MRVYQPYRAPVVAPGLTLGVLGSNRCGIPDTLSGAYTSGQAPPRTFKAQHTTSPQGAETNLRFVDVNYGFEAVSFAPSSANIVIKKFVEYPAGVFTQVTWDGGSLTKTINAGQSAKSDPCPVVIPPSTRWWERTVLMSISGDARLLQYGLPSGTTNISLGLDQGGAIGDFGNSGTIAASTGTSIYCCGAVIVDILADNARAVLIAGDSISAMGTGDVSGSGVHNGSGWAQRLIETKYTWAKIGRGSQAASDLLAASGLPYLTDFLSRISGAYTDVLLAHGRNDLGTSYNQSPDTVLANFANLVNRMDAGATKHLATVVPGTTTSDGNTTTGGQTVEVNKAAIDEFNDRVRAREPAYLTPESQVFDPSDGVSTSRNSGIWKAPPVPKTDQVHPNTFAVTDLILPNLILQ